MNGKRRGGGRRKRAAGDSRTPKWLLWSFFSVLGFGLLMLVLTMTDAGSYYDVEASVDGLLDRVERQVQEGELQRAIDTCNLAALRATDSTERNRVVEVRERIEKLQSREHDKEALDLAVRTVDAMRELQRQHPAATRPRPVARELVRMARLWLDRFAVTAEKYPDTAGLVAEVHIVRDTQTPHAQLDRPDDAADVLFAVERWMTAPSPNYRDALRKMDEFMAARPNDPQRDAVWHRRTAVAESAQAACRGHESAARQHLAARRLADAQRAVQALRAASVDKAWDAIANAVEKDIVAAGK